MNHQDWYLEQLSSVRIGSKDQECRDDHINIGNRLLYVGLLSLLGSGWVGSWGILRHIFCKYADLQIDNAYVLQHTCELSMRKHIAKTKNT